MSSELVIGIDASTTSCKALVFDCQGRVVGAGREAIPLSNPKPAWFEQDAEDWHKALVTAVRQAMAGIGTRQVAALAISNQRETFVPVNQEGKAIAPAIVWMDERAKSILPELRDTLGAGRFQQITGKPLSGNLTASKIAWLKQNEPALFAAASNFLDVQADLVHFLTGSCRTSSGSAGPTGLFDLENNRWSEEILAGIGLPLEKLPPTSPPGELLGTISVEAARACDLPAGLPLIAGIGDGQAAGIGANITQPEDAYLSLGTSVIGGYLSERYRVSQAFRTMVSAIPTTYFLETVLLGGTFTIQWFVKNFASHVQSPEGQSKEQWFDRHASEIAAGSEGLLCVPYWNSVMNPYWDASASGIVAGWRGHHTAFHFYRAILEGIAFELYLHKQGVEAATGRKIRRYIATGGGAQSDLWCQMIADVSGAVVQRAINLETAALGAGIIAAAGIGIFRNTVAAAAKMTNLEPNDFEPHEEQHNRYQDLYEHIYLGLYPALREQLRKLDAMNTQG